MPGNAGRRLLLMASQHVQTIAQLIDNSDLTPADILHQVQHLVDQGFMVADVGDTGPTVYRAVIDKPFDVDRMLEQIRTLLQDVS